MARGLHPTCHPTEIVNWLEGKKYKINDVSNIMKHEEHDENGKRINEPLPLFMLLFEATEDIKKIYEIKNILYECENRGIKKKI